MIMIFIIIIYYIIYIYTIFVTLGTCMSVCGVRANITYVQGTREKEKN